MRIDHVMGFARNPVARLYVRDTRCRTSISLPRARIAAHRLVVYISTDYIDG